MNCDCIIDSFTVVDVSIVVVFCRSFLMPACGCADRNTVQRDLFAILRTAANEATVKGMPVSFADRWHLTQRLQPPREQKILATVWNERPHIGTTQLPYQRESHCAFVSTLHL